MVGERGEVRNLYSFRMPRQTARKRLCLSRSDKDESAKIDLQVRKFPEGLWLKTQQLEMTLSSRSPPDPVELRTRLGALRMSRCHQEIVEAGGVLGGVHPG